MLAVLAVLHNEEEEERLIRRNQLRLKKGLRDLNNAFHISDEIFRKRYRMQPHVAMTLIDLLTPRLSDSPRGVPPHLQILSVLRFLAEGSHQKGVSEELSHPMSQSTFSKYLHSVIPAINFFANQFISFPKTREEREVVQRRFQERLGFPGVLGAIDCTLLKIHTPNDHEEAFVDRHQNHSLNAQLVSDMDYNILDIRIVNGSTNDQFVWNHSDIRNEMYRLNQDANIVQEEYNYFLIGDNGYTPSTVLLTAAENAPLNTPEFRYSENLRRSRCKIEQLFGLWKATFRCLNKDKALHYKPLFAAEIVLSCAILYNFLRHNGVPMPVPENDGADDQQARGNYIDQLNEEYIDGLVVRQRIINTFFA